MSTQMENFLINLSQDPVLCEKYKDDPYAVISGFNLTEEEAALIIDGNTEALHNHYHLDASEVGEADLEQTNKGKAKTKNGQKQKGGRQKGGRKGQSTKKRK